MVKVTAQHIKELFLKCELAFESCWDTLVRLKEAQGKDRKLAADHIRFQEILAEPLVGLQQMRNRISAREKVLIAEKKKYSSGWFRKQMKCLSNYRKGIDQVRNIGKGIGDAFAYYFYRNDLELLEKQFTHQRIDSTIGGIGLLGEMHFLNSIKHLDSNFSLYHGITNILRYGDFSFYDLKNHKIVEIGELKTKRIEGNQYELSLTVVSTRPDNKSVENTVEPLSEIDMYTGARLQRQVDAIAKILSPDKNPADLWASVPGTSFVGQIEQLYAKAKVNRNNFLQASSGLLYVGARLPKASLFTRIFNRKVHSQESDIGNSVLNEVRGILKEGSNNNGIILGNLLYYPDYIDKNAAGTAPLFWYPLHPLLLKELYFVNFLVLTLYNPAHILDDLKQRGYHADSKYNADPYEAGKLGLKYFDSMISLITNHLQTEQSVLAMIDKAVEMRDQMGNVKEILIKPHLNFSSTFGTPSDE